MTYTKLLVRSILILLTANSIYCNQKVSDYLTRTSEFILTGVKNLEQFIITLHDCLKSEFKVEYPYDLLCFITFGMLMYFFTRLFSFKVKTQSKHRNPTYTI